MSDLKGALKTVKDFFYKYANQDGDAHSITKKELKVLFQQELKMELEVSDLWPLSLTVLHNQRDEHWLTVHVCCGAFRHLIVSDAEH